MCGEQNCRALKLRPTHMPSSSAPQRRCPKKHTLKRDYGNTDEVLHCDGACCGKELHPGTQRFSCRQCDYDIWCVLCSPTSLSLPLSPPLLPRR